MARDRLGDLGQSGRGGGGGGGHGGREGRSPTGRSGRSGGGRDNDAYEMAGRSRSASGSSSNTLGRSRAGSGAGSLEGEVSEVNAYMDRIRSNVDTLAGLQSKAISTTNKDDLSRISRHIDSLNDECSQLLNSCRGRVKNLFPKNYKGPDAPTRKNQQTKAANQLYKVAQEYQKVQLHYKKNVKSKLERQYRIVKPGASASEIDEFVQGSESAGGSGGVFAQELTGARGNAVAAYQEVRSRHHQIKKIEQSIEELFNLFTEMSVLLDTQQEALNTIDVHIDDSTVHLDNASREMSKAIQSRKNARKRAWCILALCIILLGVIAGIVYFVIQNQQKSSSSPSSGPSSPNPPKAKRDLEHLANVLHLFQLDNV